MGNCKTMRPLRSRESGAISILAVGVMLLLLVMAALLPAALSAWKNADDRLALARAQYAAESGIRLTVLELAQQIAHGNEQQLQADEIYRIPPALLTDCEFALDRAADDAPLCTIGVRRRGDLKDPAAVLGELVFEIDAVGRSGKTSRKLTGQYATTFIGERAAVFRTALFGQGAIFVGGDGNGGSIRGAPIMTNGSAHITLRNGSYHFIQSVDARIEQPPFAAGNYRATDAQYAVTELSGRLDRSLYCGTNVMIRPGIFFDPKQPIVTVYAAANVQIDPNVDLPNDGALIVVAGGSIVLGDRFNNAANAGLSETQLHKRKLLLVSNGTILIGADCRIVGGLYANGTITVNRNPHIVYDRELVSVFLRERFKP